MRRRRRRRRRTGRTTTRHQLSLCTRSKEKILAIVNTEYQIEFLRLSRILVINVNHMMGSKNIKWQIFTHLLQLFSGNSFTILNMFTCCNRYICDWSKRALQDDFIIIWCSWHPLSNSFRHGTSSW